MFFGALTDRSDVTYEQDAFREISLPGIFIRRPVSSMVGRSKFWRPAQLFSRLSWSVHGRDKGKCTPPRAAVDQ